MMYLVMLFVRALSIISDQLTKENQFKINLNKKIPN